MRKFFIATALLAVAVLASCGKTIRLEGYAWNASVTSTDDDGDRMTLEVNMFCTSDKEGTLFICEKYSHNPIPDGLALPFTYTWDDNVGTITATYIDPEIDGVGTSTISIPMNYTKTTGLVVDLGNLYRKEMIDMNPAGFSLEKKEIYKAGNLKGTEWQCRFEDVLSPGGGADYAYFLHFNSSTDAKLTMYRDGFYGGTEEWDVTYSYDDGVGKMTLRWVSYPEDTFEGYFYLPDSQHLVYCDGESHLSMERVTAQAEHSTK